jgi:hypothetical protein
MLGRAQIPLYTRSVKSRKKTLAFFGWPKTGAALGAGGHCRAGKFSFAMTWRRFASIDLFVVPTNAFQQLFAFLFLAIDGGSDCGLW